MEYYKQEAFETFGTCQSLKTKIVKSKVLKTFLLKKARVITESIIQ